MEALALGGELGRKPRELLEVTALRLGLLEQQRAIEQEVVGNTAGKSVPMIEVEVLDDGPGVSADFMDRIFSPFFTTKPQGTGLGLAIVRKIVDAHDGRIDLSVPPEKGTRFLVTLPVNGNHQIFAGN